MSGKQVIFGLVAVAFVIGFPMRVVLAQDYETKLKEMAASLVPTLEAANQHSATVLDFTDLQGAPNELGRFLAQELSDQLVSVAKKITFVDRANLQMLLREHQLSVDGLVNPESSKKLGNLIGIDTIIFGTTTPIGSQIRLSVRAVAVETGRIVAVKASTLPTTGGLQELYNNGVSSDVTGSSTSGSAGTSQSAVSGQGDWRTQIGAGAFKFTASDLAVDPFNGGKLTFLIENLSGRGFGIAFLLGDRVSGDGASAGPCTSAMPASGIASVYSSDLMPSTSGSQGMPTGIWLPPGAKIGGTVQLSSCKPPMFEGLKKVSATVEFVLFANDKFAKLSMTAQDVPVRIIKN